MRDSWRLIVAESGGGLFLGLVIGLYSYVVQRIAARRDTRIQLPQFRDYLPPPIFMGTFPAVLATCLYLLIGGRERQVFTSVLQAWGYTILPMGIAVAVTLCLGSILFPGTYGWIERSDFLRRFHLSSAPSLRRYGIYLLIGAVMGIVVGIIAGVSATAWHSPLSLWLASLVGLQWITTRTPTRYQGQTQQDD